MVKIIEQGSGAPVVFLHSGVGSAGEWRGVFGLWPEGHRLVAVDAYGAGVGPGVPGRRRLDDYADQVLAVVDHVGEPVHLVGFSWGGATALHVGVTAAPVLASLTVVEPEAYSLLTASDGPAFSAITELRERWREHVRADRWYEACAEFIDFYNGPGTFSRWPAARRDLFLDVQRSRGDLWDVLFEHPAPRRWQRFRCRCTSSRDRRPRWSIARSVPWSGATFASPNALSSRELATCCPSPTPHSSARHSPTGSSGRREFTRNGVRICCEAGASASSVRTASGWRRRVRRRARPLPAGG